MTEVPAKEGPYPQVNGSTFGRCLRRTRLPGQIKSSTISKFFKRNTGIHLTRRYRSECIAWLKEQRTAGLGEKKTTLYEYARDRFGNSLTHAIFDAAYLAAFARRRGGQKILYLITKIKSSIFPSSFAADLGQKLPLIWERSRFAVRLLITAAYGDAWFGSQKIPLWNVRLPSFHKRFGDQSEECPDAFTAANPRDRAFHREVWLQ